MSLAVENLLGAQSHVQKYSAWNYFVGLVYANAVSLLEKVGPLRNVMYDKNVNYKDGHCVLYELQTKCKRSIFYMHEMAGIYLIHGLISEMNLMCT